MKTRRMKGSKGLSAVMTCSAVLLVAACNNIVEAPKAKGPPVAPAISINALMVAQVDHSAHVLWNVEQKGQAPKNDADWREVEHHAIQIAASGSVIALGGTGKRDAEWAANPSWTKRSQELTDSAVAALAAARAKNFDDLVKANGRLVDACEGCHKEFKPDLPTEGIMHPH
jgi:hypothetical protein